MKWLTERPRPLEAVWNILCDALEERMDAYGFQYDRAAMPRVPNRPFQQLPVAAMRNLIISMVRCSFNPQKLGTWCDITDTEMHMYSSLFFDGDFYENFGIDGYAFFRHAPPVVPSYHHTISQFVLAAGQIIDRAILYPRPVFYDSERFGFVFDGDLQLETFSPAATIYGKYSSDGPLRAEGEYKGDHGWVYSSPLTLASCSEFGRSRARNLHWSYNRAGELMPITSDHESYICPVLLGKAGIKSVDDTISAPDFSDPDKESLETGSGTLEFEIDFETGVSGNYDLSARQSDIDGVWNSNDDLEARRSRSFYANFCFKERFVKLNKENFPEINYKYLS